MALFSVKYGTGLLHNGPEKTIRKRKEETRKRFNINVVKSSKGGIKINMKRESYQDKINRKMCEKIFEEEKKLFESVECALREREERKRLREKIEKKRLRRENAKLERELLVEELFDETRGICDVVSYDIRDGKIYYFDPEPNHNVESNSNVESISEYIPDFYYYVDMANWVGAGGIFGDVNSLRYDDNEFIRKSIIERTKNTLLHIFNCTMHREKLTPQQFVNKKICIQMILKYVPIKINKNRCCIYSTIFIPLFIDALNHLKQTYNFDITCNYHRVKNFIGQVPTQNNYNFDMGEQDDLCAIYCAQYASECYRENGKTSSYLISNDRFKSATKKLSINCVVESAVENSSVVEIPFQKVLNIDGCVIQQLFLDNDPKKNKTKGNYGRTIRGHINPRTKRQYFTTIEKYNF